MSEKMRSRVNNLIAELRRMLWVLGFGLLTSYLLGAGHLSKLGDAARLATKVNQACVAIILAHLAWSQLFYYIDLREILNREDPRPAVAVAVLRGLFYVAVILGIMLGL